MLRHCVVLSVLAFFGGCGLGETAATAAAGGASSAQAAEEARKTQARIQEQIEEAQRQAADQRRSIDAAAGE